NRLTQVGVSNLSYSANGEMTTDQAGQTLVYDAWGRLVSVGTQTYAYDALNRRIGAGTTQLYYSAGWQVLEERNSSGGTTIQYVWSPVYVDAMVLRDRDANASAGDGLEERLYATHDANFNITALADTAGDVVERFIYDPYGQASVLDGNWAADADGQSDFAWQHLQSPTK